ncbi:hypothetical protein CLOP_g18292 [Closterium sp. NIES-67]|nr:hypothetical protein CLOP_g18292 [Closterium sp. NIES-67]
MAAKQWGWADTLKQAAAIKSVPKEWVPHVKDASPWPAPAALPWAAAPNPFQTCHVFEREFQLPVAASPATSRASSFDSTDRVCAAAAVPAPTVPFPQPQWPTAEFFLRAGSAAECAREGEGQGEVCMEAEATSDMRGVEESFRAVPIAQSPFHFFIREDAGEMGGMEWKVASPVTTLKRADSFASSSSSGSLDAFALPPAADVATPSHSSDDSGCDLSLSLRLPAAF